MNILLIYAVILSLMSVGVKYVAQVLLSRKPQDASKNKRTPLEYELTAEEIEEMKVYATLFGLANDVPDLDTSQILLLGRKIGEDLGKTKVLELMLKTRRVFKPLESMDIVVSPHSVIRMIEASHLIESSSTYLYKTHTHKGEGLDEEGSNGR